MDNLAKLQRRKAELAAKIEQQRADLKTTLYEVREAIEPATLLKKAVGGALGFSGNTANDTASQVPGRLPGPVSFLLDVLVRDPKWAIGLKLLAPMVLKYWPSFERKKTIPVEVNPEIPAEKPAKVKFYGRLREGISSLRGKLHKSEKAPETNPETPEN